MLSNTFAKTLKNRKEIYDFELDDELLEQIDRIIRVIQRKTGVKMQKRTLVKFALDQVEFLQKKALVKGTL